MSNASSASNKDVSTNKTSVDVSKIGDEEEKKIISMVVEMSGVTLTPELMDSLRSFIFKKMSIADIIAQLEQLSLSPHHEAPTK
jgi:hypothetical protein